MDTQFSKSDLTAVAELVLAVADRPPGVKSRGRHMLQRISEAIGSDYGCLFTLPSCSNSAAPDISLTYVRDTSKHRRRPHIVQAMSTVRDRILAQSERQGTDAQGFTATWCERLEDGARGATDRSATLDGEILCSVRQTTSSMRICLAFHRPIAGGPFTEREIAFVETVHGTCPLLGDPGVGIDDASKMPKRRREVLRFLCDGHSEKEISIRMNIVPSTVHIHVKDLYRQFGVGSRAELLTLLFRKSGWNPHAQSKADPCSSTGEGSPNL